MPRKIEKRRLLRWKGTAEASASSGPEQTSVSTEEFEAAASLDSDSLSQILEDNQDVTGSLPSLEDRDPGQEIVDMTMSESIEHPNFTVHGDTFMTDTPTPSPQSSPSSNGSAFLRQCLDLPEHELSSTEDDMFDIVSL